MNIEIKSINPKYSSRLEIGIVRTNTAASSTMTGEMNVPPKNVPRHSALVTASRLFSQVEQRSARTIPEWATPPAAPPNR